MTRAAALLVFAAFGAACGRAPDDPAPAPATTAVTSTTAAAASATTERSATTTTLPPVPQMRPVLTIEVDSVAVTEVPLRFDSWDDERIDPPNRDPSRAIIVAAGTTITARHAIADQLDVEVVRLIETARFARDDAAVATNGSTSSVRLDTTGTYALSFLARYAGGDSYSGSGTLRAAMWVQVVPPDAPCLTGGAAATDDVSGLVDADGCPVPSRVASLHLDTGLPWFHCAPWPPVLTWPDHPYGAWPGFVRVDIDTRLVDVVELPAGAESAGFRLPAGEVFTAASDPEAIFVDLGDGTAERWPVWLDDYGCA